MPVVSKALTRWIAVTIAAALFIGAMPLTADSKSAPAKIDPTLFAEAKAHPNQEFQVIVRGAPLPNTARTSVRKGTAPRSNQDNTERVRRAETALASFPISGERRSLAIVSGAAVTLRGSQIVRLAGSPLVDRVVRNQTFNLDWNGVDGALTANEAGIQEVNAPAAWSQLGATGKGVGVAVIDSGVAEHADLAGRVIARVDLTGGQSNGDPGGHGTHVAGLIAGNGAESNGAWTGTAPQADIISVRVIDAAGHAKLSTIFAGMQWVLKNRSTYHIKVVNLSLGGAALTSYQEDLLASAAELLYFAGLTVVVSAGNGGPGVSTITTPATDPFVLSVGAADDNGTPTISDDSVASWSSRGPTAFDGIAKPDLVAPGRKMISLRAAGSTLDNAHPDRRLKAAGKSESRYFSMSGSSMAAPVVSGIAALYLQLNPSATPLDVKLQLIGTARPLSGVARAAQGAGMVDALAALRASPVPVAYTPYPASKAFAELLRDKLEGQTIVWRDLSFHGGVDSKGIPWKDVTWEDITWDDITWEDITWEAFDWQDITWEDITWEDITWEVAR